jgi:hypothetical protein
MTRGKIIDMAIENKARPAISFNPLKRYEKMNWTDLSGVKWSDLSGITWNMLDNWKYDHSKAYSEQKARPSASITNKARP